VSPLVKQGAEHARERKALHSRVCAARVPCSEPAACGPGAGCRPLTLSHLVKQGAEHAREKKALHSRVCAAEAQSALLERRLESWVRSAERAAADQVQFPII